MPNWCFTQIVVTNCDSNQLKSLFEEWLEKGKEGSDFKGSWLGSLVKYSGIGDPDAKGCPKCRGRIEDIDIVDSETLSFNTETAWCPQLGWLKVILDKYSPDSKIVYTAEECSEGLYETNDPTLAGTWNVDSGCDLMESEWSITENALLSRLNDALKKNFETADSAIEYVIDNEIGDEIWFHKWE